MDHHHARISDMSLLHPVFVKQFVNLQSELRAAHVRDEIPFIFRPFETYRSPMRQQFLFERGDTRARPYRSAHQFGLAVDFVPFIDEMWSWNIDARWWDTLKGIARKCGLDVPISWDKAHVEHPAFTEMRTALWMER